MKGTFPPTASRSQCSSAESQQQEGPTLAVSGVSELPGNRWEEPGIRQEPWNTGTDIWTCCGDQGSQRCPAETPGATVLIKHPKNRLDVEHMTSWSSITQWGGGNQQAVQDGTDLRDVTMGRTPQVKGEAQTHETSGSNRKLYLRHRVLVLMASL